MKSRIHRLVLALGLCSVMLAPSSMAARRVGTAATTGFLSLTPGHVAILTLADLGPARTAPLLVQLEILDGANRVLSTINGELRPGQPLELEARDDVLTGPRLPVRARVILFDGGKRLTKRTGPRPVLTFEMMNTSTGDITVGLICFPGGGIEFDCECEINDI
ncbi:MAG TPA: hypothetical protein VJ921_09775 [Vicinamibacteria bacterium]|nr:hypothetical protein [Vicinamibacteria bacterium]